MNIKKVRKEIEGKGLLSLLFLGEQSNSEAEPEAVKNTKQK